MVIISRWACIFGVRAAREAHKEGGTPRRRVSEGSCGSVEEDEDGGDTCSSASTFTALSDPMAVDDEGKR